MLALYLQLIETSESRSDFEVFYYQYRKLMYYIAFDIVNDSHLAEDVVSETFMSLARNFAFIRTLGPISCPQIKRYVVISVKHTAFNMVKKEKRHSGLSLDDIETEWIAEENCVLDTIIENEEIEKARKAIEELPEIYREALQLYIVCEYSVDEVAKALDISKDTVYKRIQRARRLLDIALRKD